MTLRFPHCVVGLLVSSFESGPVCSKTQNVAVMVNLMCQCEQVKGCQIPGKTFFLGVSGKGSLEEISN